MRSDFWSDYQRMARGDFPKYNWSGTFCINYLNLAPGWSNVFVFASDSYCGRQQLSFEPLYVCTTIIVEVSNFAYTLVSHFENAPKRGWRGVKILTHDFLLARTLNYNYQQNRLWHNNCTEPILWHSATHYSPVTVPDSELSPNGLDELLNP